MWDLLFDGFWETMRAYRWVRRSVLIALLAIMIVTGVNMSWFPVLFVAFGVCEFDAWLSARWTKK